VCSNEGPKMKLYGYALEDTDFGILGTFSSAREAAEEVFNGDGVDSVDICEVEEVPGDPTIFNPVNITTHRRE